MREIAEANVVLLYSLDKLSKFKNDAHLHDYRSTVWLEYGLSMIDKCIEK